MNILNIVALVLVISSLHVVSAQKRANKRNRLRHSGAERPFTQSGSKAGKTDAKTDAKTAPRPQYREHPGLPKKSPYTPPPKRYQNVVIPTTARPVPKTAKVKVSTTKTPNDVHGNSKKTVAIIIPHSNNGRERDSPYNPPAQRQWRKDVPGSRKQAQASRTFRTAASKRAESTLDNSLPSKHRSLQGIPAISSIEIKPRMTPPLKYNPEPRKGTPLKHDPEARMTTPLKHNVKGRRRSRPVATTYQDASRHRDIHDAGPGESVWTRYTARPRPSHTRSRKALSANARCGSQRYSPRKRMCCQGQLVRRQGVKPSCCGSVGYDIAYNKCCNGVVSFRSGDNTDC